MNRDNNFHNLKISPGKISLDDFDIKKFKSYKLTSSTLPQKAELVIVLDVFLDERTDD